MKKITGILLTLCLALTLTVGFITAVSATGTNGVDYDKNGLVMWLDGYDKQTITIGEDGSGTWTDKINGKSYTLHGQKTLSGETSSGWQIRENGGVGYDMTIDMANNEALTHYLDLNGTLPPGDYTVEIVMAYHPLGIAETTKDAAYYTTANSFGAFKMQMSYVRGDGFFSIPESGRYYIGRDGSSLVSPLYADTVYGSAISSYTYVLDKKGGVDFDGAHTTNGTALRADGAEAGKVTVADYAVYANGNRTYAFSTDSVYLSGGVYNNTIASPSADRSFTVAENTPCTIYSIRVYNRALSENEIGRNRVSDLAAYYGGLDTSVYTASASAFGSEEVARFYKKLYALGFSADKEAVQALLNSFSLGVAMDYCGISCDFSGNNGIRAVFSIEDKCVKQLEDDGFTVEYGILGGYASSYASSSSLTVDAKENALRLSVYTTGAEDAGYYIMKENGRSYFAFTTYLGKNITMEDAHRMFVYRGYMVLKKEGRNDTVMYLDAETSEIGKTPSLYNSVRYFAANGYSGNETMKTLLNNFKEYVHIYVDAYAESEGDGSENAPFSTVQAAYNRAVLKINENTCNDVIIHLAAGTHVIKEQLRMNGADFSVADYSITFKGVENVDSPMDGSMITSAIDIDGSEFEEVEGTGYYRYQLPLSVKNEEGLFPAFRDLYVDGEAMKLATSTKEYFMTVDSARNPKGTRDQFGNPLSSADRTLYVNGATLDGVQTEEDGTVIGNLEFWVKTEWQVHCVHVEKISKNADGSYRYSEFRDNDTNEPLVPIIIKADDWKVFLNAYYSTLEKRPYWFSNSLTYLDEPGEFYYDRDNGIIYCWPESEIGNSVISYPLCERLFYMTDMKNITFDNVNMYGVTINYITDFGYISGQGGRIKRVDPDTNKAVGFLPYGAVYGENVSNILFNKCNISNVGDDGINFRGMVSDVTVQNCTFDNIGGSAVRCGQNVATFNDTIYNKNITINNNYITRTGRVFPSNTGILVTSVLNLDISYNTILDSYYSAISVGWSWSWQYYGDPDVVDSDAFVNVKNANISHNYIEDFMTGMADGGAIYVLGGNATAQYDGYLNSMNNNYIVVNSSIAPKSGQWTIYYHDSGASHWDDYNNVTILDAQLKLPNHCYASYQQAAWAYNNRTRNCYFVGYPYDYTVADPDNNITADQYPLDDDGELAYDDESGETLVGWYVYVGKKYTTKSQKEGFRYYIDEETGAYSFKYAYLDEAYAADENSSYTSRGNCNIVIEDIYLYHTFDDASEDALAEMEAIYNAAGCNFNLKPRDFGEQPDQPFDGN